MSLSKKIIYGTAWKKEQTTSLVLKAVLNGFRAIDTAGQLKHYREDLVGEALLELKEKHNVNRESLWLQTKYTSINGQDTAKPLPYNPSDPISAQVVSSCQTSLINLHTTYLDSYILHSPLPTLEQTLEAWQALMKLQDEGKVKLIGVSNTYDVKVLVALSKVRKVQVVQNRWYEGNQWDQKVFNYCKESGIMYQSFWTLTGSPTLLQNPVIRELAQKSGLSEATTVYKFAQLEGIVPLSGTKREENMLQDVAVEDIPFEGEDVEKQIQQLKAFIAA
ncbi:Aldo/keto reductase [Crepidotus variabilis]|uniref:Aldo/keto reductase n=1 Tax=Crepidotus variabilis TaxID=179855 RepID=A0A9P6JMQ3_9AGAR|nr:Aldo/keto reductase [Crepidotus variabilis]